MPVAVGDRFAGYRIERQLGRGGMSVVFLVHDVRLKRPAALKILAPELAQDERFRRQFVRESEIAASLDHPNVIPIYEAGEAEGLLFIAMRYVQSTDLRAMLDRDRALDPPRSVSIVTQAADALDAAHARDLVHRDVKPGNILVAERTGHRGADHVYLSDFGLSKRTESHSGLSRTGVFVGTPDYVAPEQIEGKPLSGRTDQYALGCVLYECLAGRPPYERDSEMAVLFAHLQEPPPDLSAARADLPPALAATVARATAKRAEDRFPSCAQFAESARRALEADGPAATSMPAPPPPVTVSTLSPTTSPRTPPALTRPSGRSSRRRGAVVLAGGAALMALVVLLAVFLFRGRHPPSTPSGSNTGPRGTTTTVPPTATFAQSTIAFVRVPNSGPLKIFQMDAQGKAITELSRSDTGASDSDPAWSPDGTRLAFTRSISSFSGRTDVFVMDVSSRLVTRLTDDGSSCCATWSPDGTQIAFVDFGKHDNPILEVMDADGSGRQPVVGGPNFVVFNPAWSPTDDRIAFDSDSSGDSNIFVVNADGSGLAQLTFTEGEEVDPAWSPDGTLIAYVEARIHSDIHVSEIFVMNADGTGQTGLTNSPSGNFDPAWAVDGSQILFVSDRDGKDQVWVMHPDGSAQESLSSSLADEPSDGPGPSS